MEPQALRLVIAANIRRLAGEKGISLNYVADFAGIDRRGFYRALNGEEGMTSDRIAKIAQALEVRPAELLAENGGSSASKSKP